MLLICPLVPCNCLVILFIGFIISSSFYFLLTSQFIIRSKNLYSIHRNANREKLNALIDIYGQKDEIDDTAIDLINEKEYTMCFMYLIIMSFCMFIFCNIFPEYCCRKRIKTNKLEHVIVQTDCGCSIVYNTRIIKEP